jgi:hypothetical protein
LAAIGLVAIFTKGGAWPLSWGETVLAILGGLLGIPLFFHVALTGRAPNWWSSIAEALDIERALRRHVEKREKH